MSIRRTMGALLLGLLAGCASAPERAPARVSPLREEIVARLRERSYSAEELGIQTVGQPGSQTIRWREIISPRKPVTVPLLPDAALSAQPRIAVRLKGGDPLPFSIDSGAGLNLADAPAALRDGVKVADPKQFGNVFQGLGGQEFSYYGMFDRVTIGELAVRNLLAILRLPSEGGGEQADNLLGLTTLAKFSWITIDFRERRATFSLAGRYSPALPVRAETPLTLQSLQLVIDLQVNGQYEISVVLDTGNDAQLMLTEDMVAALGLAEAAAAGQKSRFLGIGGVIETRSFQIDSIAIGGRKFTGVEATVVPNSFPPSLGSGFLRQFRATIDFSARKLWLE